MLYLDYSRNAGEWIPNKFGGRENLEAIDFLRQFNTEAYKEYPGIQTIAEESTAWPMVSRPTYRRRAGFRHEVGHGLDARHAGLLSQDPIHRRYHHNQLTFRMLYGFTENFVLPLSHDEVVHGKGSLIGKMPGDEWQKFANLRLLFGYMYAQPGKKLLLHGLRIWSGAGVGARHQPGMARPAVSRCTRECRTGWSSSNQVYREQPALHQLDTDSAGFEWVDCNDTAASIISLLRKSRSPADEILIVCNFTPVPRYGYRVGVPSGGFWRELLNSDAQEYGGSGMGNLGGVHADAQPTHGRPFR